MLCGARMFSSIFDDSTSTSEGLWSDFSWNTDRVSKQSRSSNRCKQATKLEHVIRDVFSPDRCHVETQTIFAKENALVCAVYAAACAYNEYIDDVYKHQWLRITKMLQRLQVVITPEKDSRTRSQDAVSQLSGMEIGDMLLYSTESRFGVIFRKMGHCTLCELVCPSNHPQAEGERVAGSYPGVAIEIPNGVLEDESFRSQVASILCGPGHRSLIHKLRGVGRPVEPKYITKHGSQRLLWLLIRFSLQSSLNLHSLGHSAYKTFMLFFMCHLANYAVNTNPPSFLLHSLTAKILRRYRKLGSAAPGWLADLVSHTCSGLSQTLEVRWKGVQTTHCLSSTWNPSLYNLTEDVLHSFLLIQNDVSMSLPNRGSNPTHVPFLPSSHQRGTLIDYLSDPCKLLSPDNHDTHVVLYDVERAVAEYIDDWIASVTDVEEACSQLENLLHQYFQMALGTYHHKRNTYNRDRISMAFLTMIELWVALDKLAIEEIPILSRYFPGAPIGFLSKLLFNDATSIHRLCRVRQYLLARRAQASVSTRRRVEQRIPPDQAYCSLHLEGLKAPLGDITLAKPSEPHAKLVAFEWQDSASLDSLRPVTCWISLDQGTLGERHGGDVLVCDIPTQVLQDRFRNTHRKAPTCPCLSFSPSKSYYFFAGSHLDSMVRIAYQLPGGPYADSHLQQYLENTNHSPNQIFSSQANCHPDLSLDEFNAFSHLRSGGSLQWLNILRELRSRTLDFHHQEVYLLLAQASSEVGPLDGNGELLWHQELQDASFCHIFLDELEALFIDLGEGSLDGPAMAIVSLLTGALASKHLSDISERANELLRKVRRKTFDWVHELLYNMRKSMTSNLQEGLKLLRDMAAVCRSTFDVGSAMGHIPIQASEDIEAALSCAMLIHTSVHPAASASTAYWQVLLDRDRRLSLALEETLKDAIQADFTDLGVDRAVQMVWPGYRPSPRRWELLPAPHSRWLVGETAPTAERRSQRVHINLLDGSLLVDGNPMSNELPRAVTDHPTYRELFDDCGFMVVSSDLPGMDFVTTSTVHGHRIHFAVDHEILKSSPKKRAPVKICAQSADTDDVFQFIPREEFSKVLPNSLVKGHLRWMNLSTSVIEIRPTEKPWEQSPDNWTIHVQAGQFRVVKGNESLVDNQSPTWKAVASRFVCLDSPENLLVTVSPDDTAQSPLSLRLSIALPRYNLSFFVNEDGDLESRDFKDMIYDESQYIGTLFGLVNRLVLCSKAQMEVDLIPKLVLIPYSTSVDQDGHNVSIKRAVSGPLHYYMYEVDSEVGCLKGFVDLESRLYLAYLHALTSSGCRADPLTGRTGVEEATSLVWLASSRKQTSIDHLLFSLPSPQIRFAALARLRGGNKLQCGWIFPNKNALLREAYLFRTEVFMDGGSHPGKELDQLFFERPPPCLHARNELAPHTAERNDLPSPDIDSLRQLLSSLRTNGTGPAFQSQYTSRLHNSVHHLQTSVPAHLTSNKPSMTTLRRHFVQCRINYIQSLEMVKIALGPKTEWERIFDQCGQWPRVTPFILFRSLASTSPAKLPDNWRECLIHLALLALDVQRARRLLRFALDDLEEELGRELENEGCDGWDAIKYPDWLLIQLQGNFLIRRVQADVATKMIAHSGANIVTQVNMGEGKTSVIIPICAAVLADGSQLVRIIAPKALIPQTLQVLTDRLSGLVRKPVYNISSSRDDISVKWGLVKVKRLQNLVLTCREEHGIIVTSPEHVLSLKLACVETQLLLKGLDMNVATTVRGRSFENILRTVTSSLSRLLTELRDPNNSTVIEKVQQWYLGPETSEKSREVGRSKVSPQMGRVVLEIQSFLETHVRDILDESDEVLRPQLQSIYAIGCRHPFEGSPDRWLVVQQVLELVKQHVYLLSSTESRALRSDGDPPGSFPHIHILQPEGGERLVSLIADDVIDGRLAGLSFHSESGIKTAIREFILYKDIHPTTVHMVEEHVRQTTRWASLLLLRGLLAHGILLFALTQRRWRVDYGRDLSATPRTLLAIPYRAKDVPAETAEFGHPEITILLTCLSYYYGGLNHDQLRLSFELLLQQDSPSAEYALWLEDCGNAPISSTVRSLSSINMKSSEQWINHLVPLFSRNKRAIDMYISNVVLPKHAKEFPQKITASYWDIAEQKNHPVTGFSGTNDGQYLLPTSAAQDDPDYLQQTGTNARVLHYLLRPENSAYMVTTYGPGNAERWTTVKFLRIVAMQNPPIRVLLDVGAQILDLSNLQVAKAWLDCTLATEIVGALYFDEDHTLMVLARNGAIQPLSSSPLGQQLHRCVAYLDDAHTRGTDLRLPRGFRAAITLGHKVTKDRLVQGCMRMRKLGQGHSVMFFAPPEIDQRIRSLNSKENDSIPVTTSDILKWAIHETWNDIERQAPYWAQEGMSHQVRRAAFSEFCQNPATPEKLADAWVKPELKSLSDMYMPCHPPPSSTAMYLAPQILDRGAALGVLSLPDFCMDEEKEREVSLEIERERETEKPPRALPAAHFLHSDIIQLVRTGDVPPPSKSKALRHVFTTGVSAASGSLWSPNILATADFCETIMESTEVKGKENHFLRSVQWVLSGKMSGKDALVLLSPFEANELMQEIKISKHVHLHLYIPRTTKRMKPSDDLGLYSIPPLPSDWTPPWTLIDQLNLFAGQLYLSDYTAYLRLCSFLGIHTEDPSLKSKSTVARNWFSPHSSEEEIRKRFEGTPLPLAMQMLAIRRGTTFAGTHMGKMLQGWPLTKEDFPSLATPRVTWHAEHDQLATPTTQQIVL